MTQHYVGTKIVQAWPADKPASDGEMLPGYGVRYEDGYTSWSPAEAFEAAYLPLGHIATYPPHVQRMIAEHAQLRERLRKLQAYIGSASFRDLDVTGQRLLREQSGAMVTYREALGARLRRAGVEV